jgi:DNA invertase Pin-like site-specific DNA recombinase
MKKASFGAGFVPKSSETSTGQAAVSIKAIAYYRTSSAANVGQDKDSLARQRQTVETFAKRSRYEIVEEFYDPAVSGADPLDARPGFTEALRRIAVNGVKTIIVETPSRFARDALVAEIGFRYLRDMGITLIAADSPTAFLDDTPTSTFLRQVLAAYSQLEKAMLVAKLKGARQRKRADGIKVEGRKNYAETVPETVALAQRLAVEPGANGRRRSLRDIAAALAEQGHVTSKGQPYSPASIARIIDQASGKRRRVRAASQ